MKTLTALGPVLLAGGLITGAGYLVYRIIRAGIERSREASK